MLHPHPKGCGFRICISDIKRTGNIYGVSNDLPKEINAKGHNIVNMETFYDLTKGCLFLN